MTHEMLAGDADWADGCLIRRPRRVIWLTKRGAATLHDHLGLNLPPSGAKTR